MTRCKDKRSLLGLSLCLTMIVNFVALHLGTVPVVDHSFDVPSMTYASNKSDGDALWFSEMRLGRASGNNPSISSGVETQGFVFSRSMGASRSVQVRDCAYVPAFVENYIMDHLDELGWHSERNPEGCRIWNEPSHPLYDYLHPFLQELEHYQRMIRDFPGIDSDVRHLKKLEPTSRGVCNRTRLVGDDVRSMFSGTSPLSWSSSGYVEPLTTPMRHPRFCTDRRALMDVNYMIHDFEFMCNKIEPGSKTVFMDIGSTLSHPNWREDLMTSKPQDRMPTIHLLETYEKFGIRFDRIYGFGKRSSRSYENGLPERFARSFKAITGFTTSPERGKKHPLYGALRSLKEEDFVVIVLDTSLKTGQRLAQQLVNDGRLAKLVDQFYFEHPVHMKEMARVWQWGMEGSLKDTFELFSRLRKAGVPAHFWV